MVITSKNTEYIDDGGIIFHKIIDENGDLNLASILIDGSDIYDNLKYIERNIQFLIDNYNHVNKFIIMIDYGEAELSKKTSVINSFPGIKIITDTFKKNNIFHKLVYRSNGLNPQVKTDIKFEPITFFLGRDIEYMFDIESRNFQYHFLSLYRGYKPIREHFHKFLVDSNILNKTLFSYNSEGLKDTKHTFDYSISLENESVDAKMLMKPGKYFKNTFCSLVYEAYWDENVVFFTEKINKCILAGQPFIIISTPKYIDYLKKMGFKTFSNWWDESYDSETNNSKRIKKIENLITEISKWDLKKCEEIYKEMIPILKENQELLNNISNNRIENTYHLIKYQQNVI